MRRSRHNVIPRLVRPVIPRLVRVIPRLVRGICALALATACSNPRSVETFVPAEEGGNSYAFTLDMTDTTQVYDLSFYGRIDGRVGDLDELASLPLYVCFTDPEGVEYGEEVMVPLTQDSPLSRSFTVRYRSGMVPVVPGEWGLTLTAPQSLTGLHGVGIILENNDHGTR